MYNYNTTTLYFYPSLSAPHSLYRHHDCIADIIGQDFTMLNASIPLANHHIAEEPPPVNGEDNYGIDGHTAITRSKSATEMHR